MDKPEPVIRLQLTTAVRFQLRDPTTKGIHLRNYTSKTQGGKKLVIKPESEHSFNKEEAIVSVELWERGNASLDARYMKRERRPARLPRTSLAAS